MNLPYPGHMLPTLGLLSELSARGHYIVCPTDENWFERVRSTGAIPVEYTYREHHDGKDSTEAAWHREAYRTCAEMIDNFDLLVYETFSYGGKTLADRSGKPCVRLNTTVALTKSVRRDYIKSPATCAPYYKVFGNPLLAYAMTRWFGGKVIPLKHRDMLREMEKSVPELDIVYLPRELQPHMDEVPDSFRFVGHAVSLRGDEDEGASLWPEGRKRIFASMGTNPMDAASAAPLRRLPLIAEAFKDSDYALLLTSAPESQLEELNSISPNIRAFSKVPQLGVLKSADLFITHGGANSVCESLYFGVPMLAMPMGMDQGIISHMIDENNFGRMLRWNSGNERWYARKLTVTDREIRAAAESVLNDETVRLSVDAIKTEMRAYGSNRTAADEIEAYAKKTGLL